jgi:aerobic carbon-monoxide dehydrogenase medium subunit
MYGFNYQRPTTIAEALAARRGAPDSRFLAGGMTLIASLKHRLASPSDLIDLAGLPDLDAIRVQGNALVIGAMATHDAVATSTEVCSRIPTLAALVGSIGDPQVRNRGTIGGAIANNDPAADYPAAILGLGGTIVTDRRRIAADQFFDGLFTTALDPDELIVEVDIPVPKRAGYAKFRQSASGYAIVGVFVAVTESGVRVAVTGARDCVYRHVGMEHALRADFSAASIAAIETPSEHLSTDMHASAEFRAHLIGVMAGRAVAAAG